MRSRIWKNWRYISNRASKVSIKNISKSSNRIENFMERFMMICFRVWTVKVRSIQEMIRSDENFLNF